MAPVKWSVPEVFAVGTHKPVAPQPRHEAIATTARAKPRARSVLPHTHVALAPLEESVQLRGATVGLTRRAAHGVRCQRVCAGVRWRGGACAGTDMNVLRQPI